MTAVDIVDLVSSPDLLGEYFDAGSHERWTAVLKAAYGKSLTDRELTLFREVAGDRDPPARPVRELVCVVGRGGGKTKIASIIAAHAALNFDRHGCLPGERGTVAIVANTKDQAGIAHAYVAGYFELPRFAALVEDRSSDNLSLTNGAEVVTVANSFRAPRGKRIVCAIYDELSTWRSDESATPDHEVDAAITPGMIRHPGSVKVLISSAYRRAGLLYERYTAAFGQDNADTLVVLGTSLQFNPTLDAEAINAELVKDEARASAEYLSIWRDDISNFVDRTLLDEVTDQVLVRPPDSHIRYRAFADEAGGGPNGDASTLAIAHTDPATDRVIVDGVWIWKAPFSESAVIDQKCRILRQYRVAKVVGDGWGGNLIPDLYSANGKVFQQSAAKKSLIYAEFLTILNARGVRLTSDPTVRSELLALERRSRWGGGESIDHPQIAGAHDDAANAVAGVVVLAATVKTLAVTSEVIAQYTAAAARGGVRPPYSEVVGKPDNWKRMSPAEKMHFEYGPHSLAAPSAPRGRLAPSLAALNRARSPGAWTNRATAYPSPRADFWPVGGVDVLGRK